MFTARAGARPIRLPFGPVPTNFAARYGAWALVAGASEGLGAAFARALARRGMNLVLVARRPEPLERLAHELRAEPGVEVRTHALDLAAADSVAALSRATALLEVGVAIYNAAYAPLGAFIETSPADLERALDVNVRGPLLLARALAPPMVARRRGAIVLMSSLAGMQGTPRLAAYAASKAFDIVLAESLWAELAEHGVDVLTCCAGAIRTPGYADRARGKQAPGTLDPEVVVERTLVALGRGPRVIPGFINLIASLLVGRLFPRRLAIKMMAATTRELS
jgi:short-subunit dehydrogenase